MTTVRPTPVADPLLAVSELGVTFGSGGREVHAVRGVSFSLEPGRTLGIVGESGAGKTAVGLALLGLHDRRHTSISGAIRLNGHDLVRAPEPVRGRQVGMVFQDPLAALDPYRSVGSQIAEVYRAHRQANRRQAWVRAVDLLDRVGIDDPRRRARAYPHQLSGGQRQRALIAMAVSCDPKLLIADEPTTALDVTAQAQILALLQDLQRDSGLALLLITHDLGVIAEVADDVVVMLRGAVVERGPTRDVIGQPTEPYTRTLLAGFPSSRTSVTTRRPSREPGRPVVELVDVAMHFATRRRGIQLRPDLLRAVDGVNLTVLQGETLGLIGESGCGKSTLARIMVRLLEPTSGRVLFEGRDVAHLRGRDLRDLHRDVQLVFQNPLSSLNPRQTVARAIGAPFEIHSDASPAAIRKATGELLELVGLRPAQLGRYPHELSGGQQQRVAIARALALRPKVLVADEPFAALDVSTQARIVDLLAELHTVREFTLVVVAHDLSVIQRIADRVAVMYLGRIVELADAEALYASPRHPYTGALLSAMPVLDPTGTRSAARLLIPGDVPSPYRIPSGCRFRTRCPLAREECATSDPQLRELAASHVAACHYPLSHFT